MLLSVAARECLEHLGAVRGYSPATLANYGRTYNQFVAFLQADGAPDSVAAFTPDAVMRFMAWLGNRKAVGNTILNKLHALSALARYLQKRTDARGRPLLTANPTKGVDKPTETRPEAKFLLPAELAAFVNAPAPAELVLPRLVLVDTGLRCGELCDANAGDLRDVGGAVYLTLRVKGRRQAGSQPVSVPLSAACAAAVKANIAARGPLDPSAPLFLDRHGRRFSRSQMTTALIRLGERAGVTRLTTSPHKLRHTANVIARLSGVDQLTRAAMLNHRSLKTLARYDHLVPGEVAKGRELQRQGLATYLAQGQPAQSFQVAGGTCETGPLPTSKNVNEIAVHNERVPCVSPPDNYSI